MSILPVSMPGDPCVGILRGKRVVVAEAEGVTVMLLQSALRREGAHVVAVCRSAAETVPIASEEKLDLILIELLPNGAQDIVPAVRQLSKARRACVVIMAAAVSDRDEEHLRAAGAAGFVIKPFTVAQLLPLMQETCDTRWSSV